MEYIKKLEKIRCTGDVEVYKGRHVLTNRLVILKQIKPNALDDGIPASAIREISLLKELQNHSNIVQIENVFVNSMEVVLLFEFISMDLKTYMQRLPINFQLPQTAIQSYLYQIANGIAFCHQRRIFHRNLCPQNILITRKGVIKITDFDTARSFESTHKKVYTRDVTMLSYRSPEILLGTSLYTPKVDIWSMGCILAEMLLRKPLFQSDSEIGQIYKIVEVLGTPNEHTWPDLCHMPYYFSGLSVNKKNRLNVIFKGAPNAEILKQMLKFNPMDRISAKKIQSHQFFLNFNPNLRIPTIL